MKLIFDKKLSLLLIPGFILFTAIGTVSHEGGHYFAAKYFGYVQVLIMPMRPGKIQKQNPFLIRLIRNLKYKLLEAKIFLKKKSTHRL